MDVGTACELFQLEALKNLPCKRIQCDEIWCFVGAKESNVPPMRKGEFGRGDVYTWVAIDPESKLVASWLVGKRNIEYATIFMQDLGLAAGASRPTNDRWPQGVSERCG